MNDALLTALRWMDELYDDLALPGLRRGRFMGHPALVHRGRSIVGTKDGEVLVVLCPVEVKEVLLETEPDLYFETDHYRGYPAILIRPEKLDRDTLRARITAAWAIGASERQRARVSGHKSDPS